MTHQLVRGTIEYLDVVLTADVVLTGTVEISFDRETWTAASWQGDPATTRTARILLDTTNLTGQGYTVFVRLTDNAEIPIIDAGALQLS